MNVDKIKKILSRRNTIKEQEVINHFKNRNTLRKISELTGVPKSTVGNIIKKHKISLEYTENCKCNFRFPNLNLRSIKYHTFSYSRCDI